MGCQGRCNQLRRYNTRRFPAPAAGSPAAEPETPADVVEGLTRRGHDVVVKVLAPEHRDRLEAESRAMARLGEHPNVLSALMVGHAGDGTAWVVTERMAATLREASEEVGAPPGTLRYLGEYVFEPATDWRYTTVVVEVEAPFGSSLNFETDEVDWFHLDQVDQLPLHFGFASAWPHLRAIVER